MCVMVPAVSEVRSVVTGKISNLQRCSVHDGPGIRTTVFLKGCPLACTWCHNPETIDSKPQMMISADRCVDCGACRPVCPVATNGAAPAGIWWDRSSCRACGACVEACPSGARELAGTTYGVEELVDVLERDRPFFDESGGGVTFSGGEPMAQPEFLIAALRECRSRGLHTVVDTCGFAPCDTVEKISEIADLVLYDLKHIDGSVHRKYTGVDNRVILDNLDRLSRSEVGVWIRIPLIPGFNDDLDKVRATGEFLASLPRRHRVFLLPYHPTAIGKTDRLDSAGTFTAFEKPSAEKLESVKDRLENCGLEVTIGGA